MMGSTGTMPTDQKSDSDKPMGRCPICGGSGTAEFRPFCSRRCADVDLARWLRGSYAIASEDDDNPNDRDLSPPGEDAPDPRSTRNPTRGQPH
jgi:endogenous inhibitor of DNA gyrase (YacG/DUF329 family)